ncbi:hypothetical protein [Capnocytophaga sp. oral taxon 864]|uniref:hypothetical protein n=1 Tax=Capnocytophaga sp. oral taxon 864 TaxID=1316593 RepID=UPI000D047D77|nr:hypothetical protein [Capnocytophaga sp. oral taxon 864]AVM55219.1 hypothetical protein C3V44_06000 [Capnocytophaga sp. oral taxon 864]
MKRIMFLVLAIVLFSCKDKGGVPCQVPPPDFSMWVNKKSEVYKEFINERGNIDSTHIALYKQVDNTKKEYPMQFHYETNPQGETYLYVGTQLWFENDVYTGKAETLYLQNATKTYKIEVNGYMKDTDCGLVPITNEIYVDGVKVENHYLAK